jgi:hypothetical protein
MHVGLSGSEVDDFRAGFFASGVLLEDLASVGGLLLPSFKVEDGGPCPALLLDKLFLLRGAIAIALRKIFTSVFKLCKRVD